MDALGNGRLTSRQKESIKREVQIQYDKEIDNAENFGKFFTTIAACEVLEEVFKFDEDSRRKFLDKFIEKSNEISEYINSNTCIEGDSDKPIFDKDYNIEILNRYAAKHSLKFDESWVEY